MAECDKFRMQFTDYLDGELPVAERTELEAHLAICESCAETLRQIRIIQQSLQNVPTLTTSPGFETRLHQMIREQETRSAFPFWSFQGWKVPAMGSALVLASLGLFLVFNHQEEATSGKATYIPAAAQISTQFNKQSVTPSPAQVKPVQESEIATQDTLMEEDTVQINHRQVQFITGH